MRCGTQLPCTPGQTPPAPPAPTGGASLRNARTGSCLLPSLALGACGAASNAWSTTESGELSVGGQILKILHDRGDCASWAKVHLGVDRADNNSFGLLASDGGALRSNECPDRCIAAGEGGDAVGLGGCSPAAGGWALGKASTSTVSEPNTAPAWYNQTYSYPDGIGALIIEGPFPYKNGPAIWSDANPFGAYGMVIAPGTFDPEAGGQCTPLPPTSPFASSRLSPVKMTDSIKDCLIGCNWTAVQATGVDPCNAGSLPSGQGLSNSVMSCFDLGPGTEGHGGGACGYNCSLLRPNATDKLMGCTKADFGKCRVYCDSRTFPNANATAQAWALAHY